MTKLRDDAWAVYKKTNDYCYRVAKTDMGDREEYNNRLLSCLEYCRNDADRLFLQSFMEDNNKEISKLKTKIRWLSPRNKNKGLTTFNTDSIREMNPLDQAMQNYGYKVEHQDSHRVKFLCPFHNEKTASFSVDKNTNKGHCFGCGRNADVIDLVMHLDHSTFQQACKKLSNIN